MLLLGIVIGIVIGILVGAVATYLGLASQLAERSKQIECLQRDARDMELAFADRLQGQVPGGREDEVKHLTNQRVSGIAEIAKLKGELAEAQAEVILAREAALRHPGSVLGASPAASIPLNGPKTTPPPKPTPPTDAQTPSSPSGRILDPWGEASEEVQFEDDKFKDDKFEDDRPIGSSEPQSRAVPVEAVEIVEVDAEAAAAVPEVSVERLDAEEISEPEPLEPELLEPELLEPNLADAELSTTKAEAIALYTTATTETSPGAVRQLLQSLGQLSTNADPDLRREAIAALGKLRTPRALPFLRQALQDPDVTVATAASEAIASFRGYQPKLTQKRAASYSARRKI
ncbi:MAG: HEAT repeat domain-containing protein [Synechococcales cyanobacterium CRU_2_2]|nr:HEAT repeat domain-containing protein [Synechococcales cyanobacterium CRU_2_2]